MTHEIKIRKEFADAVACGSKCFEIRENDRGYQKDDIIHFKVVDKSGLPICHQLNDEYYTVTYVLSGWGIKSGYVAFGIKKRCIKEFAKEEE